MSKKAFTLVEIIIVVIITGILASVGIPRIVASQEKGIVSEAVTDLSLLFGAQQRYALDHGGWAPNCGVLDVTIAATRFNLACTAATVSATKINAPIYTVSVSTVGVYTCPACPAHVANYLP